MNALGSTSPVGAEASSRTLMQGLLAELHSLASTAKANLDAAAGQRNRLLGDLPPNQGGPERSPGSKLGDSVSFSDLGVVIMELRESLMATNDHLMSLRRIG